MCVCYTLKGNKDTYTWETVEIKRVEVISELLKYILTSENIQNT